MNYELLCEVLLECLQDFRTEAKRLQADCNAFRVDYEALHKERDQLLAVSNGRKYKVEELQSNMDELQESNNQLQATLAGLQSDFNTLRSENTNLLLHRNSLQAENNKLILERDELKTDLKEQIDAGMWLKHEIGKVIKDRDQLRDDTARLAKNWDDCENKLKESQSKNNELKMILKDRGVIVIDDSIVRENNNG